MRMTVITGGERRRAFARQVVHVRGESADAAIASVSVEENGFVVRGIAPGRTGVVVRGELVRYAASIPTAPGLAALGDNVAFEERYGVFVCESGRNIALPPRRARAHVDWVGKGASYDATITIAPSFWISAFGSSPAMCAHFTIASAISDIAQADPAPSDDAPSARDWWRTTIRGDASCAVELRLGDRVVRESGAIALTDDASEAIACFANLESSRALPWTGTLVVSLRCRDQHGERLEWSWSFPDGAPAETTQADAAITLSRDLVTLDADLARTLAPPSPPTTHDGLRLQDAPEKPDERRRLTEDDVVRIIRDTADALKPTKLWEWLTRDQRDRPIVVKPDRDEKGGDVHTFGWTWLNDSKTSVQISVFVKPLLRNYEEIAEVREPTAAGALRRRVLETLLHEAAHAGRLWYRYIDERERITEVAALLAEGPRREEVIRAKIKLCEMNISSHETIVEKFAFLVQNAEDPNVEPLLAELEPFLPSLEFVPGEARETKTLVAHVIEDIRAEIASFERTKETWERKLRGKE